MYNNDSRAQIFILPMFLSVLPCNVNIPLNMIQLSRWYNVAKYICVIVKFSIVAGTRYVG